MTRNICLFRKCQRKTKITPNPRGKYTNLREGGQPLGRFIKSYLASHSLNVSSRRNENLILGCLTWHSGSYSIKSLKFLRKFKTRFATENLKLLGVENLFLFTIVSVIFIPNEWTKFGWLRQFSGCFQSPTLLSNIVIQVTRQNYPAGFQRMATRGKVDMLYLSASSTPYNVDTMGPDMLSLKNWEHETSLGYSFPAFSTYTKRPKFSFTRGSLN